VEKTARLIKKGSKRWRKEKRAKTEPHWDRAKSSLGVPQREKREEDDISKLKDSREGRRGEKGRREKKREAIFGSGVNILKSRKSERGRG